MKEVMMLHIRQFDDKRGKLSGLGIFINERCLGTTFIKDIFLSLLNKP